MLEASADTPRPVFRRRLRERFSEGDAPPPLPTAFAIGDGEQVGDLQAVVSVGDAPVRISAGKKKHGVLTRG